MFCFQFDTNLALILWTIMEIYCLNSKKYSKIKMPMLCVPVIVAQHSLLIVLYVME